MRILVVDDHLETRELVARHLARSAYGVAAVGTCAEALAALDGEAFGVLVDARERTETEPSLPRASSIPLGETTAAKDDGRLPMTDHNTRIFVVGAGGTQARQVAEGIVKDAFHNVSFFAGTITDLPELSVPASRKP